MQTRIVAIIQRPCLSVQGVAWLQQKAQQGCSIVWAGDLNWTEAKDGPLPLGAGW